MDAGWHTSETDTHSFHYYPVIHHINPFEGSLHGGLRVTVVGTGFVDSPGLRCRFGSLDVPRAQIQYINSTCIEAISPAAALLPTETGTPRLPARLPALSSAAHLLPRPPVRADQRVTVTLEVAVDGEHYSRTEQYTSLGRRPIYNRFTYYVLPILGALYPSRGPQRGGTPLRIYGQHFVDSGSLMCHFNVTGPVNYALRAQVHQSSLLVDAEDGKYAGEWPFEFRARAPERAADGNRNGEGGEYCAITQAEEAPWWQVDLGHNRTVQHIRVLGRTDQPAQLLPPFWILVSYDVPFENMTLDAALDAALYTHFVPNATHSLDDADTDENSTWANTTSANGTGWAPLNHTAFSNASTIDLALATFEWQLPDGAQFRYVRVQLHPTGVPRSLALAEVEVESPEQEGGHFVDAVFYTNTTLTCITPGLRGWELGPQGEQAVEVRVTNHYRRPLDFSNPLTFTYQADPRVLTLSRNRVHLGGSLPVVVHGVNFVNSSDTNFDYQRLAGGPSAHTAWYGQRSVLQCRFGHKVVYATYLGPRAVKCVAPQRSVPLVVDVEVTLNGVDWTTDNTKLVYYGRCPPGHFCPDFADAARAPAFVDFTVAGSAAYVNRHGDAGHPTDALLVPCPRGSFCGAPNRFAPEPCPPGTFTPDAGLTACLPCPVGYECPHHAMHVPQLCRAGYVCARAGIALSEELCPPGHYCMRGTKTAHTCQSTDPNLRNEDYPMGFNVDFPRAITDGTSTCTQDGSFERVAALEAEGYEYVDGQRLPAPLALPTEELAAQHNMSVRPIICRTNEYCGPGVRSAAMVECNNQSIPECYRTPQPCATGYICLPGSETPRGTGQCPTGFFCPGVDCDVYFRNGGSNFTYPQAVLDANRDAIVTQTCPCPPGSSCPGTGRTFPALCNPGEYSDAVLLVQCKACPEGFTCPAIGQVVPTPCQPGFICDALGLGSEQKQCTGGHFCVTGTVTPHGFLLDPLALHNGTGGGPGDGAYVSPDGTVVTSSMPTAAPEEGQVRLRNRTFQLQHSHDPAAMFRLGNLFGPHFDAQHRATMEGRLVDELFRQYSGYLDPTAYWRASAPAQDLTGDGLVTEADAAAAPPVLLLFNLSAPALLDRVRVYPLRATVGDGDLPVEFAVEVLQAGAWRALAGMARHQPRRGFLYVDFVAATAVPYLNEAVRNATAAGQRDAFPSPAVGDLDVLGPANYWLSIPYVRHFLRDPILQRVLPTAAEQAADPHWHSRQLPPVTAVRITLQPRLSADGEWFAVGLDNVELFRRAATLLRPQPCDEQLYCLDGVRTPDMDEGDFGSPQPCPPGAYCETGTDAPEGSALCPPGHFCEIATAVPVRVGEGQFAGGSGNSRGTACFPGQFASAQAAAECTPCPLGFYCPATEPPQCYSKVHQFFLLLPGSTCDAMHAVNITAQSIVVGQSLATPAARNDTVICKEGFVCPQRDSATLGERCPGGHYCLPGTLTASTAAQCTEERHCVNVLQVGREVPDLLPLTAPNGTHYAVTRVDSLASWDTASAGTSPAFDRVRDRLDLARLSDGRYPFICPDHVEREAPYIGAYPGCVVYHGLHVKGVRDTEFRISLRIERTQALRATMSMDRVSELVIKRLRAQFNTPVWWLAHADLSTRLGALVPATITMAAPHPGYVAIFNFLRAGGVIDLSEYLGTEGPHTMTVQEASTMTLERHRELMWRGLLDGAGRPAQLQDSLFTVPELCARDPSTMPPCEPAGGASRPCNATEALAHCLSVWHGEKYNGMWRVPLDDPWLTVDPTVPDTTAPGTFRVHAVTTHAPEAFTLHGGFVVWGNGDDHTVVPHDATAAELRNALVRLFVTEDVQVARAVVAANQRRFRWTVTFGSAQPPLRVSAFDPQGWPEKGATQRLFMRGEVLHSLEQRPTLDHPTPLSVWVSNGRRWQRWQTRDLEGVLIKTHTAQLRFDFARAVPLDMVRVYPYVRAAVDARYASADYSVEVMFAPPADPSVDAQWVAGAWVSITANHTFRASAADGVVHTQMAHTSSDLREYYFNDHLVPAAPVGPPYFVNDTWWQPRLVRNVTAVRVTLLTHTDPANGLPYDVVALNEVEFYTRDRQFVPGEIVLATLAKYGNPVQEAESAQCCLAPIPCQAGAYCLGGNAHRFVYTERMREALNDYQDPLSPQEGINGAFFSLASSTPNGDGLCPPGYFCPPGTAVPYPCWDGHYCRGPGATAPQPCNRGEYAAIGTLPFAFGWDHPPCAQNIIRCQRRFWHGTFDFLRFFPPGDWVLVQGRGQPEREFSAGMRQVLARNGRRLDTNYTATVLSDPLVYLVSSAALNASDAGVKDTDLQPARRLRGVESVAVPVLRPGVTQAPSFSVEMWVKLEQSGLPVVLAAPWLPALTLPLLPAPPPQTRTATCARWSARGRRPARRRRAGRWASRPSWSAACSTASWTTPCRSPCAAKSCWRSPWAPSRS